MKKIIIGLLILLTISGCNRNVETIVDYEYSGMGIVSATGAPSLAFINSIDDETFETNAVPSNIVSMMTTNSDKRVVVIDTISGINAIKKGAPYKLMANITFGNFYIASTGNDDNDQMDEDDTIVIFGQGITPDVVFHYIYGDKFDNSIEYVQSVQDAGKCLAVGKNLETGSSVDYVFIAEPVLTNILNNSEAPTYGKAKSFINIQDEYYKKSNLEMIQASIFVKDDGYIQDYDDYSHYLEENIEQILTNKEYVEFYLNSKSNDEVSSIFGIGTNLIYKVLADNSIGLGYKKAIDNKEAIDNFVGLFGGEATSEEIYIK